MGDLEVRTDIEIRRAIPEDAPGIHEAHMRSIREVCSQDHTPDEIAGWGHRPYNEEQRRNAILNQFVWVVEKDRKVEGYAQFLILKKKENEDVVRAHILGLYLTKEVLGQGLGKKLFALMLDQAKQEGAGKITLESTLTAHDFYQSFGFVDSGPQITAQIGASYVRCFPMSMNI